MKTLILTKKQAPAKKTLILTAKPKKTMILTKK